MSELVNKGEASSMQMQVDQFVTQSKKDGFQLNKSKCKELRISFSKVEPLMNPIAINGKAIGVRCRCIRRSQVELTY